MSSAEFKLLQQAHRSMVFRDTTNIAASQNVSSGYIDVRMFGHIHIFKMSVGGTYQLQIAWSWDKSTSFFTETITVNDISRNTPVQANANFAKFIVSNTHISNAFTSHETVIHADNNT